MILTPYFIVCLVGNDARAGDLVPEKLSKFKWNVTMAGTYFSDKRFSGKCFCGRPDGRAGGVKRNPTETE